MRVAGFGSAGKILLWRSISSFDVVAGSCLTLCSQLLPASTRLERAAGMGAATIGLEAFGAIW